MAREIIPSSGTWSSIAELINNNFDDLFNHTGWAEYTDTQYTTSNPFLILANTDTKIPNNAGAVKEQELPTPYNSSGFYNTTTQKILGLAGDSIIITIEAKIRRQSGAQDYDVRQWFDIGGSVPPLYERTIGVKGNQEKGITSTTTAFTLDTWESNGADFMMNATTDIELFNIRYIIHRLHAGKGTYP